MASKGLQGVVIGQTKLADIDGDAGELIYVGYDIDDLAHHVSFEEVCFLLWNGRLPKQAELTELQRQLGSQRALRPEMLELLRAFPRDADPMAALRTAVSALGLYDSDADDISDEALRRKSIFLTAQVPTLVATFHRLRSGAEPLPPRPELGTAADFLYLLNGEEASATRVKTMDAALVLHAEHGMNASTFSARVTAGTKSDLYSAITSAIGTLKGPLHGGANVEVMHMLREIDESGVSPREWVLRTLDEGGRVMGFGHRVYRAVDPRAKMLREMADEVMRESGDAHWLELSDQIRAVMDEEMQKRGKKIYPNVDFFSASVYTTLGIPMDLFSAVFAIARVSGWTAHLLEQYANNRLIRPESEYIGPRGLTVEPIAQR